LPGGEIARGDTARSVVQVKAGVLAIGLACLLAGCTHGSKTLPTTTTTTTRTIPAPTPNSTGAIDLGPVTSAAGTCPYAGSPAVADALGIRLGRQVVLSAGGAVVGCQFFATTDPAFVASEHLPGPNQPVLQIMSSKYPNATDAQNAMVSTGTAQGSPHSATVAGGIVGVAYQTAFDPTDGNQDWAFVFSVGSTLVTVITAQSDSELDAQVIAGEIAPKFSAS
jgi:hypothetical protein